MSLRHPAHRLRQVVLIWLVVLGGLVLAARLLTDTDSPYSPVPPADQSVAGVADAQLDLELVPFASGISQPTAIVSTGAAGDDRLFVVERTGKIRTVDTAGRLGDTFLDISDRVGSNGSERGLLGLVFHPRYADNGYFYVNYTDKRGHTHIARFTGRSASADPASEKQILFVEQPYANHNAGDLAFGPNDGYLYIPLGDGGSGGDPQNRAQDPGTLLGKILRLDVDGGDPYRVPADNPFITAGGYRPEIWAIGLRNPWRISFDRQTRDLYIGDVGQNKFEEIDFQPADSKGGQNYGWRCYEATVPHILAGCGSPDRYTAPVAEYRLYEDDKCSLTGGYVYRGKRFPKLSGRYFYGDYCGGQLFTLVQEPDGTWKSRQQLLTGLAISTFGEGPDGELYVADYHGGQVYRLQSR